MEIMTYLWEVEPDDNNVDCCEDTEDEIVMPANSSECRWCSTVRIKLANRRLSIRLGNLPSEDDDSHEQTGAGDANATSS